MAETRFIKTVTFGGYDKSDVDKRLEYLYSQVYELKNELRETKLTLEEYKKGTDEEKAHETVLSTERAKLTAAQVQNENLSKKLKDATEGVAAKDKEIATLKSDLEKAQAELDAVNNKLQAIEANGNPMALSNVFIEAQKSANMLIADAKKQAEELDANSKTAAENAIIDANNKAAQIIYEAEKRAAEIDAESQNNAEMMNVASENAKAVMLKDVQDVHEEVAKIRKVFEDLQKAGLDKLEKSEKLLTQTENKLTNGGVPVFRDPKFVDAKLPDAPKYQKAVSPAAEKEKKEKDSELDKLMAMASSLDGGNSSSDDGELDLDALAKQAAALGGGESPAKSDSAKSSGGDLDLDAILKAAESL